MKWVTREKVKVDRVACPWLIKKFIDAEAEFLFVPADKVLTVAEAQGALPYDMAAQPRCQRREGSSVTGSKGSGKRFARLTHRP
jgi:hypothetical protein